MLHDLTERSIGKKKRDIACQARDMIILGLLYASDVDS